VLFSDRILDLILTGDFQLNFYFEPEGYTFSENNDKVKDFQLEDS
jgi:hypothetical protein